jgi:hypothetical protein
VSRIATLSRVFGLSGHATHAWPMKWRWLCVLGVCASLVGCGASEEERVAEALESYPHALAAGDGREACAAFTREGRRSYPCDELERIASEMTPAQRRRSEAAEAVRIEVDGDRATAYLRYGDCIVTTSGSVLVRDDAGDWRIERMGASANHEQKRCVE